MDAEAPVVSLTAPTDGARLRGLITISAVATDNVGVKRVEFYTNDVKQATVEKGASGNSGNTYSLEHALAEGANAIVARAHDAAGNHTDSTTVNVTGDNTAPETTILKGSGAAAAASFGYSSNEEGSAFKCSLALTSVDASAVTYGACNTTDPANPGSYRQEYTGLAEGEYTFRVYATDGAGNADATPAERSVTVLPVPDTTPPTVSLTRPTAGEHLKGALTLSATASDAEGVARVEFYVNDGVNNTLAGTVTSPVNGSYSMQWGSTSITSKAITITARAYDAAGNTATTSGTAIVVDNSLPSGRLTISRGAAWTTSTSVRVAVSATDAAPGVLSWMQLSNSSTTWPSTWEVYSTAERNWTLPAGDSRTKSVYARFKDKAGNISVVAQDAIGLDTVAPSVSMGRAPGEGAHLRQTVTLSAAVSDLTSGVKTVTFTIKNASGATVVSGTGTRTTTTGTFYTYSWNTALKPDGRYTITVGAVDNAGRFASTAARSVIVDNTKPSAPSVSPKQALEVGVRIDATGKVPVKVTWGAGTDANPVTYKLEYRRDAGTWQAMPLTNASLLTTLSYVPAGSTYAFRVTAVDRAGNQSVAVEGPSYQLMALQESTTSAITYSTGWTQQALTGSYGGSVRYARVVGNSATMSFSGSSWALVTTLGPDRGQARVYNVHPTTGAQNLLGTVDSRHAINPNTTYPGYVLAGQNNLTNAPYKIKVEVAGTAGRPRVDVDAFLTLRPVPRIP